VTDPRTSTDQRCPEAGQAALGGPGTALLPADSCANTTPATAPPRRLRWDELKHLERCESGRIGLTANELTGDDPVRGFKSLPLRCLVPYVAVSTYLWVVPGVAGDTDVKLGSFVGMSMQASPGSRFRPSERRASEATATRGAAFGRSAQICISCKVNVINGTGP
jgi:hypothetical protein